jgi:hypothetical protein
VSLLVFLFLSPFPGEHLQHFLQNPFRRPASCNSCLLSTIIQILFTIGALENIEFSTPHS